MRISDWSSDVCSSDLVEIVGRLVEHQQVRVSREFTREQQPRALAARKRADERVGQFGIEQELLEIALDVLLYPEHLDPVAAVGEHVADALVGGHQLDRKSTRLNSSH